VITVRPFKPYHVDLLLAQGVQHSQARAISHLPGSYASVAPQGPPGPAVSAFVGDRVLICGGIIPMAPKRGICWALLSEHAKQHMTWLHYATKRFITLDRWQRLEATVEEGFGAGCRWVELLGFKYEGSMPHYGDDDETHLRYARYG
jgi:hypothetical protein